MIILYILISVYVTAAYATYLSFDEVRGTKPLSAIRDYLITLAGIVILAQAASSLLHLGSWGISLTLIVFGMMSGIGWTQDGEFAKAGPFLSFRELGASARIFFSKK